MDGWWIGAAMESFAHNLNKRDWKLSFVVEPKFCSQMTSNYVYWMKLKNGMNC